MTRHLAGGAASALVCCLLGAGCGNRLPCATPQSPPTPMAPPATWPATAPASTFDLDPLDRQRELPPVEISAPWLARGRQRFDILCAACHGRLGDGVSAVARAGLAPAPINFHVDRLRQVPIGHLYTVATRGTAAMPAFGGQLAASDRWAIATYLRTLQLSQDADVGWIPTAVRLENGWDR